MDASATPPEIPLFDLRVEPQDVDAVAEVLRSGWLTMGPRTAAFEERFAAHLGCRHAVALSSGTAALHLAYLAAGVGPGDEVVVPSFSFVATAAAVRYCGATPVFADVVGLHDPSIDPEDVAARITPRTRAIACTHFAGYAAPVGALAELAAREGVALIEDAAHAPATDTGDGRAAGTVGLAGAFSFFSNKVLSAGEGGLLATDDDAVATAARQGRSHAMTSGTWDRHVGHALSYDVVGLGFNYRLDEPRAALLDSRMDRLADELARRRALTHRYREALRDLDAVVLPFADEDVQRSSCYVMPIMLADPARQVPLREALRERHGIQTSLLYPPSHRFTAYRDDAVRLPRTELASRSEVTLPLFAHMTDAQLDRVVAAVRAELG